MRFTAIPDHIDSLTAFRAAGFQLAQYLNHWAVVPPTLVHEDLQPSDISRCKDARWLTHVEYLRLVADIELDEVNMRTIERWPDGSSYDNPFRSLAYAKAYFEKRRAELDKPFKEAVREAMRMG